MKNPSSPVPVAITMGDPLGVGPEIIVGALSSRKLRGTLAPVVVGLPEVFSRAARLCKGKRIVVRPWRGPRYEAWPHVSPSDREDVLYVVPPAGVRIKSIEPDDLRYRGRVSFACVKEAASLCREGFTAALVTAPLSKASLRKAGMSYPGHTEMLKALCGSRNTVMMFVDDGFRLSLVTTHVPVASLKKALTKERIEKTILLTERGLRLLFGVAGPKMAILSLNPHAGEGGTLGSEEARIIQPAMQNVRARGASVFGPFSADGFFAHDGWKNFDAVIAMYHDQGLVAAKLIGRERVVNVTLGLPFVRTSPAHGTGEDIAWRGIAKPDAMISAILLAVGLAGRVKLPLGWTPAKFRTGKGKRAGAGPDE